MQGFTDFLKTIGAGRIIAMGIVAVMLLSFFGFISMRLSQPQLGILYADLDMGQTAEITARLDAMQIPHRLTDNGHTVMVPRDRLMDLRIQLAGEGIGGGIGYELLDNQDRLGTTSFLQNINHRRAVEGELARTISRLNMVRDARIHLVLPERQLFAREQDQPSASITLTTRGTLGSQQVAAIRQLVAASVPALSPDRISIVDQNGSLLARSDGEGDDQTATALEERREKMERSLENSVERLLERTLGPGRVRAEVSVELDREAVTEDSQIYDPDRQVVVSSETQSTNERSTEGTPEAVSVAGNLPDGQTGAGASDSESVDQSTEIVNYDNSLTRVRKVKESGAVRRISVAVLVDGVYETTDDGSSSYTPRSDAEIEQLKRLVQNAIGFDEKRNDSVEVINLQFVREPAAEVADAPLLDIGKDEYFRLGEMLTFAILGFAGLFMVWRLVKYIGGPNQNSGATLSANPQAAQLENNADDAAPAALAPPESFEITPELASRAAEGDEDAVAMIAKIREQQGTQPLSLEAEIDVAQVDGKVKASAIKKVGEIVSKHPEESASIIRNWLYAS